MLLDMARNGVHVTRAHMSRHLAPRFKGFTRGIDCVINILAAGRSNLCERFRGGRIDALDILATGGLDPLVIDKQAKGLVLFDPGLAWSGGLWSRTVFHCFEDV